MEEQKYKEELIKQLLWIGENCPYAFYIPNDMCKKNNETDSEFLNSKTLNELIHLIGLLLNNNFDNKYINYKTKELYIRANEISSELLNKKINNIQSNIELLNKKINNIQSNIHTTEDVINLFTDIDKNRISTDNRIDKLEQKINEILIMLQKK